MNMRNQFVQTTRELVEKDERTVVLLGDISTYNLRETIKKYPERVFDIGILEQSSISMAAGLAIAGMNPIFHTIAPFIVERAYEQLKLDFGYQNLNGNFISVGASFDYSSLGSTHHCPADVGVLKEIPNMQIIVPGTAEEFDGLYRSQYANGSPTYYRLSDMSNTQTQELTFGKANVIRIGKKATIIAVGPMLDAVMEAASDEDVTVLYYTTLAPFDGETLRRCFAGNRVLLCEPYYEGALAHDVLTTLQGNSLRMEFAGVPHQFMQKYGTLQENLAHVGMDARGIHEKLSVLLRL